MFIIGREYANHLAKSAVVRPEFDNHIKQLFMVIDSSGDAQLNVAEFVMFIITTKQVQAMLAQVGRGTFTHLSISMNFQ